MVVARLVLHDEHAPLVTVIVAFACVIGHNYSIFLRGKGGKGVATGAGAALAMMPIPMAIVVVVFVVLLLHGPDRVGGVDRRDHLVPGDGRGLLDSRCRTSSVRASCRRWCCGRIEATSAGCGSARSPE